MSDALRKEILSTERGREGSIEALEKRLDEIRDVPCAALFGLVARQLAALGPDVHAEVRPLGVLFHYGQTALCELSLYGELFLARFGPGLAVEVRVRSEELALLVLDQVLRNLLRLRPLRQETVG
jgi:hypothetical protein